MKLKISLSITIIGAIVFAVFSAIKTPEAFAPAADFPRDGALVYVQIEDLPAFIKLWNESSFKEKYAQSESFGEFQNNHLGKKLASRWHEFSDAAGFPIDLESVAQLTQNKAALAVYDVGKMDFVFIAPVSEEVFAATKFALNKDKFEEQTLDDGTTVYRANVEADRGRQKQELIFCNADGRFVLATSEKLMAQTLQNFGGANTKNRLLDAPTFSALKDKITPHLATVWVNQTALNEDYYFKRYWMMPGNEKLKNIRAGIFDLEIEENKIVENRKFLLENAAENRLVDKTEAARLLARLPENIPFYQLRTADAETIDDAVQKTFFERDNGEQIAKDQENYFSAEAFFDNENYSFDYEYLSDKFDETIDDEDGENESPQNPIGKQTSFSDVLRSAQARSVLTFTKPRILPAPLFLRFDRVAVFYLAAPEKFNRDEFEKEITGEFARRTMIAAPGVNLEWRTVNDNSAVRRELSLPMLGISAYYIVRDNEMILSGNADFFSEVVAVNSPASQTFENDFTSLSVVNLSEKDRAYNDVFNLLAEKKAANDFFSGNVESFIASLDKVKRIEITGNEGGKILEERLVFFR